MPKVVKSLRNWCEERDDASLLEQWDLEKNEGLEPGDVSWGSHRPVWWRCPLGHSWQAAPYSRAKGAGCPYCAGRRVWKPQESSAPTPIRSAQPAREDRPAV